jgi:hypothetical protein
MKIDEERGEASLGLGGCPFLWKDSVKDVALCDVLGRNAAIIGGSIVE